jgi:hypothetical protein
MIADFLTKPLHGNLFTKRNYIMNINSETDDASLMESSELHRSVMANESIIYEPQTNGEKHESRHTF